MDMTTLMIDYLTDDVCLNEYEYEYEYKYGKYIFFYFLLLNSVFSFVVFFDNIEWIISSVNNIFFKLILNILYCKSILDVKYDNYIKPHIENIYVCFNSYYIHYFVYIFLQSYKMLYFLYNQCFLLLNLAPKHYVLVYNM